MLDNRIENKCLSNFSDSFFFLSIRHVCFQGHQLKRWYQEILAYKFVIMYRLHMMMKNIDTVSLYIDPLIHTYFFIVFIMRTDGVCLCHFTYNFDVLLKFSNPHHIKMQGVTRVHHYLHYPNFIGNL